MSEGVKNTGFFGWFYPRPAAALAEGRLSAIFTSFDEVSDWVDGYGKEGELMLRAWLSYETDADKTSRSIARIWLEKEEASRLNEHAEKELQIAQKSARSAEKSAKWTMCAAIAAFLGTFITAVFSGLAFIQSLEPVDVNIINSHEIPRFSRSLKNAEKSGTGLSVPESGWFAPREMTTN